MSGYLGRTPGQGQIQYFTFTATAGQTTFSGLDNNKYVLNYDIGFCDVFLNGRRLTPTSDYTALDGSTIVLQSAASVNDVLFVASASTFDAVDWVTNSVNYVYIATAGQTVFTGSDSNNQTLSYVNGTILVSVNGMQIPQSDYTATNGTTVTLDAGVNAGDIIQIFSLRTMNPVNIFTQSQSDARYLQLTGGAITGNVGIGTVLISPTTDYISSTSSVDSWNYEKFIYVGSYDIEPRDVFFSSDGTKMFVLGNAGDDVGEFALSTAWQVNTAVFTTAFSVAGQDTVVTGLCFKPDGTKFYIVGTTNDTVYQYALSVAWDISTASYESKSFSVTSQETDPQAIRFKPDGTKMYVMGTVGDDVNQYDLSTAWDVTTATYVDVSPSIATYETTPQGLEFSSDGSKIWIVGSAYARLIQLNLSTPWQVNTAVYSDHTVIASQGIYAVIGASGLFVNESQNKAYITDYQNDSVFQLSTSPTIKFYTNNSVVSRDLLVKKNLSVDNDVRINGDIRAIGAVSGTSLVSPTISGSGTGAHSIWTNLTTQATTIDSALTTGTLTIGGSVATGGMVFGRSTANQTISIANGATTSGNVKTIEVGLNGLAGSQTNITVGSSSSNTLLTVNANNILFSGNVGIGNTTPAHKLSVNGDMIVNTNLIVGSYNLNDVGIRGYSNNSIGVYGGSNSSHGVYGQTSTGYGVIAYSNSTGTGLLSQNDASGIGIYALANTGTGAQIHSKTGNPLFVGNVGSTFVSVIANGRVGIGNTTPADKLQIDTTAGTKKISFHDASHDVFTTGLGSAITFSRPSDGSAYMAGIFSFNNGSLGLASRNDVVLATGGGIGYANTNEAMRVSSNGNVGIGNPSPGVKLDVVGAIKSTSTGTFFTQGSANLSNLSTNAFILGTVNKAVAPTGGTGVIQIVSDDASASWLQGSISLITDPTAANRRLTIGCIEQGTGWRNITLAETAGNVIIANTTPLNGNARLSIWNTAGGSQGFATGYGTSANQFRLIYLTNTANALNFDNGTNIATLSSAGAWTNASDARIKKNIVDIKYGLEDLLKTKPRSFNMKSIEGDYIGFVAQELQEIIPEVVSGDPEKQLGVDYGSLVAVAFKAIQELKAELDATKARLSELENK